MKSVLRLGVTAAVLFGLAWGGARAMELGTNLEQTGLVTFNSPGNRVWSQSVYDTDGAVFATIADPWNPNFLQDIRYYQVLRFMDWGRTNPSVLDHWANRRHKTDIQNCDWSEDLGIAYEWWIHLANRTQKDMWINVPHLMCDRNGFEEGANDFCRRWAILLKHGVDTGAVNLDALGSLETLTRQDFIRILLEPKNALIKQYEALLATEGIQLVFRDEAISEIARIAEYINDHTENIGARRLHTVLEKLLDEISFEANDLAGEVVVDAEYVNRRLDPIMQKEDLSRYIL